MKFLSVFLAALRLNCSYVQFHVYSNTLQINEIHLLSDDMNNT